MTKLESLKIARDLARDEHTRAIVLLDVAERAYNRAITDYIDEDIRVNGGARG